MSKTNGVKEMASDRVMVLMPNGKKRMMTGREYADWKLAR